MIKIGLKSVELHNSSKYLIIMVGNPISIGIIALVSNTRLNRVSLVMLRGSCGMPIIIRVTHRSIYLWIHPTLS